jgi:branched-chain amino acid transport system ATP-binding protein
MYGLFPELERLRNAKGLHLSGGERQMLSIARTLATNPDLLHLDEPSEGLAPHWVDRLVDAIAAVTAETAMGLILVEHHIDLALSLTIETLVLEQGRIAFYGPSAALRADQRRREELLGLTVAPRDA